jgi:hypothetical protein
MSDSLIVLTPAADALTGFSAVYSVVGDVIAGQPVSDFHGPRLRASLKVSFCERLKERQIIGNVGNALVSSGPYRRFRIFLGGTIPIDPFLHQRVAVGS